MDIKHYDIGLKWIDKIYHVSDVHIRTLKRHREYREVFRNLFDHIAQHATDNSIAVVTGDIGIGETMLKMLFYKKNRKL